MTKQINNVWSVEAVYQSYNLLTIFQS